MIKVFFFSMVNYALWEILQDDSTVDNYICFMRIHTWLHHPEPSYEIHIWRYILRHTEDLLYVFLYKSA